MDVFRVRQKMCTQRGNCATCRPWRVVKIGYPVLAWMFLISIYARAGLGSQEKYVILNRLYLQVAVWRVTQLHGRNSDTPQSDMIEPASTEPIRDRTGDIQAVIPLATGGQRAREIALTRYCTGTGTCIPAAAIAPLSVPNIGDTEQLRETADSNTIEGHDVRSAGESSQGRGQRGFSARWWIA